MTDGHVAFSAHWLTIESLHFILDEDDLAAARFEYPDEKSDDEQATIYVDPQSVQRLGALVDDALDEERSILANEDNPEDRETSKLVVDGLKSLRSAIRQHRS